MTRLILCFLAVASCSIIYDANPGTAPAGSPGVDGATASGDGSALAADGSCPVGDGALADAATVSDAAPAPDAPGDCGIYNQNGCNLQSEGCYWNGYLSWGDCLPKGVAPDGAPCSEQTECSPGFVCSTGACHKLCTSPSACSNLQCVQIPESEHVYACGPF